MSSRSSYYEMHRNNYNYANMLNIILSPLSQFECVVGSSAALSGLKTGDRIVRVDDFNVTYLTAGLLLSIIRFA